MAVSEEIYLGIGDLHFCKAPARIRTVLGSCVSITLWHPARHIGGMCHFMLPNRIRSPQTPLDGRYADEAMQLFDREISRHRARAADFQAKVFGGGNMFPGRQSSPPALDVGLRNITVAHRLLAERGIPVVAEHLGGDGHRKLIFDVASGEAWLAFQDRGDVPATRSKPCPPSV
ncbi:chemotaxis protein CheD [Pseudothauera lacus]|uniref:Probable chemoreceptor glutamine deamidase CheD n=1 Tax=Pseudothauera lacus TaxID=2136175 RepID=A0A2T4ICR1_9RHOO|nr:chemotaxis protein CheD [Pseudothauera lacus]PTD95559.1 chemotaxis protein CheD [Pseudothauera lacus]